MTRASSPYTQPGVLITNPVSESNEMHLEGVICSKSHGHRHTKKCHLGSSLTLAEAKDVPVRQQNQASRPLGLFSWSRRPVPLPKWSREPGGPLRGTGPAGKEPPAPGTLSSCALGAHGAPQCRRASAPSGCADRMRCLRVNRACFPFTPSGSVFMKNFLLLALWEYSFLACAVHG